MVENLEQRLTRIRDDVERFAASGLDAVIDPSDWMLLRSCGVTHRGLVMRMPTMMGPVLVWTYDPAKVR